MEPGVGPFFKVGFQITLVEGMVPMKELQVDDLAQLTEEVREFQHACTALGVREVTPVAVGSQPKA